MDKGFAVLEIDQEFKTLISPLRKDEYLKLEVNLTIDGCRDPIIAWNKTIVDGHNRYEICNLSLIHIFFSSIVSKRGSAGGDCFARISSSVTGA